MDRRSFLGLLAGAVGASFAASAASAMPFVAEPIHPEFRPDHGVGERLVDEEAVIENVWHGRRWRYRRYRAWRYRRYRARRYFAWRRHRYRVWRHRRYHAWRYRHYRARRYVAWRRHRYRVWRYRAWRRYWG